MALKPEDLIRNLEQWRDESPCACRYWAREPSPLLTMHHPACPNAKPLAETADLIKALLAGIEAWAGDEDGIPDVLWDTYCQARFVVGRPFPKESFPGD